jgi:hypothetical protein
MSSRACTIRHLLEKELYVLSEEAIADAIVTRARVRALVAGSRFANTAAERPVRSFRPDPSARSFRLARSSSRRRLFHA